MRLPVILSFFLVQTTLRASVDSWVLDSPDGRCAIAVTLNGEGNLSYNVFHNRKGVILDSPLGLKRQDQLFDHHLTLHKAGDVVSRREVYELFTGPKSRVNQALNHRTLSFRNSNQALLELELAASNEGVAFRYRFPESEDRTLRLDAETTGFRFPITTRAWMQPYHAASDYTPAYEDFYFFVSVGEPPPNSRGKPLGWAFPALFHVVETGTWALVTETGTDQSFCACHLDATASDGLYRIAFPAANEATKRQTNQFGPEPRFTLPWTMPWRVIVLSQSAGDLATATLVTDLAAPSRVADTTWIHPGRASWAWWSFPEGPNTETLFNKFTDFASRMKWEYTLFDAGWWKPGLSPLARHAQSQGITPLAWCFAGDFYRPDTRKRKLDELQSAGVGGVKVDFWCSDRQESIAAMQALFEEAATRHMVVNLHGCTLPRGWQRTWPNFLTAEAVLGAESYFYESRYSEKAAELNTVLPFTRNAVGPMDYAPIACSPKKYRRTTTAAHELATSIVFTSGLIHFADQPEYFNALPDEARQVLSDAPARWDETQCLLGEPGQVAVFARRSGKRWFIAGLNGTEATRPITIDLSRFKNLRQRLLITEGPNANMEVAATSVPVIDQWSHRMPARGGFILRMMD